MLKNIKIGKAAVGFVAVVVLVCSSYRVCEGYSILTHEEIVDLLWAGEIKPLLHQKFPQATEDDLRKAHAYAYGGCLIQDMGYYPFGNKTFSDLVHYVRSGDFVIALLDEAQDINEYAFALGALTHYAADNIGHPVVNAAVAQEFPKLAAKYGPSVTYAENKKAHIRTEFGFDVVQVASAAYAPEAYHTFIGFQVSKPLLERAFSETYGIEMKDVFLSEDLAIGTYRHAVATTIPEMTKVAWGKRRTEILKVVPGAKKQRIVFNLRRGEYEKRFGADYEKPHGFARFLSWIYKLLPKIGPFRAFKFSVPTAEAERVFLGLGTHASVPHIPGLTHAAPLTHVEALVSPSLFIIGGGISRKSDKFLPLLTGVRAKIVPAALHNDAGIVGAAMAAAAT